MNEASERALFSYKNTACTGEPTTELGARLKDAYADAQKFAKDNGLAYDWNRIQVTPEAAGDRTADKAIRASMKPPKEKPKTESESLTNFAGGGRISNEEIVIDRSVGAKALNYDIKLPNEEIVQLTEGTRITNIEIIAGKDRERQIDEIVDILDRYGGSEAEWQKKKGFGYVDYKGESYYVELHWYEEPTVGRRKWKVKPDKDGNWFIDD